MQNVIRKGDWIQTYKSKQFWPLDPKPEDVDIEDIAHALSLTCRFGGHCNNFYSVAQHSVLVSYLVKRSEAMAGLLHDGTEAYIGDIVKPLKIFLPDFNQIEKGVERIVFEHFGIFDFDRDEVKHADRVALYTELRDLMNEPPQIWKESSGYIHKLPSQKIIPLNPKESEELFLKRYHQLSQAK